THTDTHTRALVLEDFKVIRNKSSTIDGGRLHFHISFTMRFVRPQRWLIPWSLCALTNFPFARHTLLHTHIHRDHNNSLMSTETKLASTHKSSKNW
uniref:Uncharacterized protein n=1 Tax=Anopheles quadriannulatus TaxID=34691 RepID=A0A182XR89_ANOQN